MVEVNREESNIAHTARIEVLVRGVCHYSVAATDCKSQARHPWILGYDEKIRRSVFILPGILSNS